MEMFLNRKFLLVVCFWASVTAVSAESEVDTSIATTCAANFTEEGSFFTGKTYKTWVETSGVPYDTAFRKVVQAVAANAWGSPSSNKDTGIITASQAVTMGEGAAAPLNIIVQARKGGVIRVDVNFSTAGGQLASAETAKVELCKLAEAPGK